MIYSTEPSFIGSGSTEYGPRPLAAGRTELSAQPVENQRLV
jgi:hypothetical protein